MNGFDPWGALAGGALIGAAAILLLALDGRIAGVSGVAGRLWFSVRGDRAWRWLFLLGLVIGAGAWAWASGDVPRRSGFPPWALLLGGALVGYGTSLGGGCTSGHGVCGLARFSLRSLVAVIVFLSVAIATTFVARHVLSIG